MEFLKGHGTGNDFVLLPDPDGALALTPELVAAVCDRHRGIGADGVLRVVRAAKHPDAAGFVAPGDRDGPAGEAEWFMDYWNADGSFAEMCGNGVRVFARYLTSSGLATDSGAGVPIATRSGVVRAMVGPEAIAVDMGQTRVYGQSVATLGALSLPGTAVEVGNPHLVCPLPAGLDLAELDLHVPPGYDTALFPGGVNVEFVTPAEVPVEGADLHVRMRVYERGSGETLSCGSGACAVAAAALADVGMSSGVVAVDVPGGRLTLTLDGGSCTMAGPAVLVARGTITL